MTGCASLPICSKMVDGVVVSPTDRTSKFSLDQAMRSPVAGSDSLYLTGGGYKSDVEVLRNVLVVVLVAVVTVEVVSILVIESTTVS